MTILPTPPSRTIFSRCTHWLARDADVPRHSGLKWLAALVLLAPIMAGVTVKALTLPESIPDFSLDTSRPGVQSVQTGPWSSASTWQGGQIPTSNSVVSILLAHTVTINDTAAVAYTIAIHGKLAFAPSVNTRLRVTNLQVMAGEMGMGTPGVLEVGTAAAPIAASVTAEILIANTSLGGSVSDPLQFGTGLMMLGKVSMHGSVKTPTFTRLATEPRAGHTTLTLSEAVAGWRVGDRLVLPDTRHIKFDEVVGGGWMNAVNQWEERTVQAISADSRTLTLNSGLQYDHLGARDYNNVLDFLPHVGNLTRNVIVRSESATGTRGHTISTHMAEVDIRYALFKDLGRTTYQPLNTTTNHIGRYPIHMHHLSGPMTTPANGYQFTLQGNAVDGGSAETKFKWGLTVHATHYGSIKDNVVYNYNGAGVATEDGSESFNVFDHNFALRGIGEPSNSVSEARMAMGTEGVGFWFRGPNNYVKNNVAANYQNPTVEAAYGYAFLFRGLGNIAVPNFKGAHGSGQFTTRNGNNLPILQFENNEAYGAMQGGFTQWWTSSLDPQPSANAQVTLIKDLKLWNIYNKTVYMYPSQKITFDGLKIRGNYNANGLCCGNGIYFADYSSKGIIVRNSDIQGMNVGITAPEAGFGPEPNLIIENSYLRNNSNLAVPTNGSVNGCWMDNKLVVASNTRFDAPPGRSLSAISMVRDVASAPECLSKLDEMRVYAYNGVASDNFQVYHSSSAVVPRPPGSCSPLSRPWVNGIACTIAAQGPVPPTATFGVSPTSIPIGQSATLSWNATNATTVSINQGVGTVAASGTRSVAPTATTTYTLTATNSAGSTTATATLTVAGTRITPTITWNTPASIVYLTALSGTQLNATTTVPGSWAYSPAGGTVLGAGAGQALSVTFNPTDTASYNSANASVAITVLKATPLITWANPADISSGTALSATQLNSTVNVAGSSTYTPPSGTMLGVGAGQPLSTAFTPTSTANYNGASRTVQITVTGTPTTGHNAARANSYDDVWQGGSTGWVANAKAILAAGSGQTAGLVLWIGDSLTRHPALGTWAQTGAGKTAGDQAITTWMHAGLSPQSIDSIDGFALATPYFCPSRSYTVGDGLGAWHFMGTGMPADTNPATARQKLENCTAYPNMLNLTTMLTALQKPQFAIPEVNLEASNPGVFTDLERMVDLMISKGIVPIIITYTYRENNAAFNQLVDQYNTGLVAYAQSKKLPLIDFNKEMLARLPLAQWPGRFLGDGTHYTSGTTTYPAASDPYANGGDPATHTTGLALTYNGYGMKGWLGVQKMKEIKALVLDTVSPTLPTVTVGASPASITSGAASTLTWSSTNATTVAINQGIGAVALSGTRPVSPTATTTYTVTATNAAGSVTATATVTVTPAATLPTVTISASPASITSGAASTLTWSSTNATTVSINQGIGAVALSGTRSVSPTSTTTYTATATNAAGSATAASTVTVSVSGGPGGIGINFVGTDGLSMGAAESAGVVAKPNWNTATGVTRSTPLALVNETGSASGATVTWTSNNLWSTSITDQAGNRRMMKGYLDTSETSTTSVTVAGLPSGAYDVYVYADGDNVGVTRTAAYTISGGGITTTTINLTDPVNTNFDAAFTPANNSAGNYVKFSINAGGFTMAATPLSASGGSLRAPINGIQIVPTGAPAPDFTIGATPASRTVTQGSGTSYAVTVGALNGFVGAVSLAVSGLPLQATASFTPPSVAGSGSATLNVTTAGNTPAGSQSLTITGTSGSLSHTATVTVTVLPTLPTVTLSASPASIISGGASTLTWSSTNATTVAIDQGIGAVTPSGTRSVSPTSRTTYTVTATNTAGSATATATVTVSAPPGQPTITLSSTSVTAGGNVMATIADGPGNAGDWLGLTAAGAADAAYVDWKYLNGTRSRPVSGVIGASVGFTMPAAPGTYNVRFFLNDSWTKLATSATITVTAPPPPTITLSATTVAPGGTVTATMAGGPGYAGDWFGLNVASAADGAYMDWRYLNGTQIRPGTGVTGAAVTFTMPTTPGTYNVRFFLNDSWTKLTTSATITVQ